MGERARARNQELTPILTGRVVQDVSRQDDALHIGFDDGSTRKVKTAAPAKGDDLKDRKVKAVRQTDGVMHLDLEDRPAVKRKLAEAISSDMPRDSRLLSSMRLHNGKFLR
jgi:hypothetical protein